MFLVSRIFPGTWNPEPGTWNPEPGTWNPEPGTFTAKEATASSDLSQSGLDPRLSQRGCTSLHNRSPGHETRVRRRVRRCLGWSGRVRRGEYDADTGHRGAVDHHTEQCRLRGPDGAFRGDRHRHDPVGWGRAGCG